MILEIVRHTFYYRIRIAEMQKTLVRIEDKICKDLNPDIPN